MRSASGTELEYTGRDDWFWLGGMDRDNDDDLGESDAYTGTCGRLDSGLPLFVDLTDDDEAESGADTDGGCRWTMLGSLRSRPCCG